MLGFGWCALGQGCSWQGVDVVDDVAPVFVKGLSGLGAWFLLCTEGLSSSETSSP